MIPTRGHRTRPRAQIDPGVADLLQSAPVAFVAVDTCGDAVWQNPAAEDLLGADAGTNRRSVEVWSRHQAGAVRLLEAPGRAADGSPLQWLIVTEGQADKALLEAFAHQALHDPLTGLPNRTLLDDRISQALNRASRSGGAVAVAFLDLDQFKLINDTQGHAEGDALLRAVAKRLHAAVRGGDTVARFGGDEFVVVCEAVADAHQATELAERLHKALEAPVVLGSERIFVSASLGVALGGPESTPEELLRDADAAMYHAKLGGRARTQLFDEEIRTRAAWRRDTENALRSALDVGQLTLLYQPIVSLEAGWVVGAEALVRWSHPERGTISPNEFIPVAEESGLIVPLGEWALDEACRQLAQWRAELPRVPLFMSVNMSARQLRAGLSGLVLETAGRHSVDPSRLVIEITEGSLMADTSTSLDALNELRAIGAQIALDDFGVGYSSLGYLKRFPIDTIKVDRGFVAGLGTDVTDSAIVSAIAGIARGLRIPMVAEGVETAEQLQALRRLACQNAQGHKFAPPLTPWKFTELVASGRRW